MSKYVALKMKTLPSGTVGRWIVGEVVSESDEVIVLKNSCAVYDFLKANKEAGIVFPQSTLVPDDILLEAPLSVYIDEVEASRYMESGSNLLRVYEKALVDYRADKAGLTLDPNKAPKPRTEGVVTSLHNSEVQ